MPTPMMEAKEFQVRAEHKYNQYFAMAPRGLTLVQLLAPDCWKEFAEHQKAHGRKLLGLFDVLRVRAADGGFDCLFTVVAFRADGSPILQIWPRSALAPTEQPVSLPRSTPRSREDALATLGLHKDATPELIEKTAALLRKSWHEDFATGLADQALRHERSTAINVAYEILTGKRKAA